MSLPESFTWGSSSNTSCCWSTQLQPDQAPTHHLGAKDSLWDGTHQYPGKVPREDSPGMTRGVATDGSRNPGLTLCLPTGDDTCRDTQVSWDWERTTWWALPEPTEGKIPLGHLAIPFPPPGQPRTQRLLAGRYPNHECHITMKKCSEEHYGM